VLGVSLGTATIRATFEALSAQRSLRVVPDYAGTWSGEYRIAGCTWTSGRGPDFCRPILHSRSPLKVALNQAGAQASGTLEFYSSGGALVESGSVDGSIDESYTLLLSGMTRSVDPVHPSETTVADWRTRLIEDDKGMIGRFVRNMTFINAWGPQQSRMECEIIRLERAVRGTLARYAGPR